jgi:hypothetical protein
MTTLMVTRNSHPFNDPSIRGQVYGYDLIFTLKHLQVLPQNISALEDASCIEAISLLSACHLCKNYLDNIVLRDEGTFNPAPFRPCNCHHNYRFYKVFQSNKLGHLLMYPLHITVCVALRSIRYSSTKRRNINNKLTPSISFGRYAFV